jgi:hypothetical protein
VAGRQSAGAITRVTLSPTKQGFSEPSTSRVKRVTTCHQPPPASSTETISARPRTLESTGTGAGKRILLTLHQLFGPIPMGSGKGWGRDKDVGDHDQPITPNAGGLIAKLI